MKSKFFIGAYYGPIQPKEINDKEQGVVHLSKDFANEKYYKMIADLGIRTITYMDNDYNRNPEGVIRDLKLAEKFGLQLFILDKGITGDMTSEQLKERIAAYKDFPSFAGIYVVDEPTTDDYMKNCISRRIQKYYSVMQLLADNGITAYMNMLPYLHFMGTKSAYRKLYEKYTVFCKTPLISFDRYVFDNGFTARDWPIRSFFTNLDIAKEYSDRFDIPFCPFIQAGSQWNDGSKHFESKPYFPNERQMFWHINCCLLWGAKGIQYFPLIQPHWFAYGIGDDMDYGRNGVIGANGVPTRWYDYVKHSIKWIEKIETILIDSKRINLLAKGYYPEKYTNITRQSDDMLTKIEISDERNGTIIGAFEYKKKRLYIVLNYNHDKDASVTLKFNQAYPMSLIRESLPKTNETTNCQKLNLDPGEATLIIVG